MYHCAIINVPHYKLHRTSSLQRDDPSAQKVGFLALLLQPTYHLVWIPFRGYKYIHAKILQIWSRIWTWESFCLLVYWNTVQQSAFLFMMLIFKGGKIKQIFLEETDSKISRHAAFWVKRRHHEWLDLKTKTRYDLVCSLLFLLYKDNSWLPFHGVSEDCLKWCVSTPGICFFPNTEPPWCFIALFIAVTFRSTKHLTKKDFWADIQVDRKVDWKLCDALKIRDFLGFFEKWDSLTLADQFWAYQTSTDLTIDARRQWLWGSMIIKTVKRLQACSSVPWGPTWQRVWHCSCTFHLLGTIDSSPPESKRHGSWWPVHWVHTRKGILVPFSLWHPHEYTLW